METVTQRGDVSDRKLNELEIRSFAFVIAAATACFVGLVFVGFAVAPADTCTLRLNSKINPNGAPVASLCRLPGIGTTRAWAIVEYRIRFREQTGQARAFKRCRDLQEIKGIGPTTIDKIRPWLSFEQDFVK